MLGSVIALELLFKRTDKVFNRTGSHFFEFLSRSKTDLNELYENNFLHSEMAFILKRG